MKIIYKNQTQTFKNGEHCTAEEYSLGDKEINGAVVELTGRYPEKGRVVNLKCKELAYVIRGSGNVVIEGQELKLQEGDLVFIEPGEKFVWDGHLTLFIPCTPAWYPEQHKEVE